MKRSDVEEWCEGQKQNTGGNPMPKEPHAFCKHKHKKKRNTTQEIQKFQ